MPASPTDPVVATILPPREGFGPRRTGAVGLIVRRFATGTPGFRSIVFGGPQDGPGFPDVDFHPINPAFLVPGTVNLKFTASLIAPLLRLRPALIEVHNRVGIALGLARLFSSTPVLLFLHNDPLDMRRARTAAERGAVLGRVAGVATVSTWLRDQFMQDITAPVRSPDVVPNCIDLAALPPPGRQERLVQFVGRVVRDKGPDSFVTACASALPVMPGWRAEIIGSDRFGVDSPDTAFVQMVRAMAEGANVAMLGYRDHPDVLTAMRRAAIIVVPSRWQEPFGLVALEAMACGATVIASGRGGLPEVLGDAALYIDPDDPAAIATAIRALARDEARRSALAEAGRARARQFDLPVVAGRLAELRRRVMAGGG
jgi:UDP-glucose:(glucosyl)LPS alpha-1,2-glucosyltransferase